MTQLDKNATAAMQGMLAHQKRYRPRAEDQHLHWHQALANEAYDIAAAMEERSSKATWGKIE